MKKYMLLLPNAMYSYLFMFNFVIAILAQVVSSVIMAEKLSVILGNLLPIIFIADLICNMIFVTKAVRAKWDARELLKSNLILKWVQFPANIIYMLFSLMEIFVSLKVIQEGVADNYIGRQVLSIVIINLILYLLGVLLSAFIAITAIVRAKSEGLITKRMAVFCEICSCLAIADVVTAQILYLKGKRGC